MDIQRVLLRFAAMDANQQAWVMTTLLDFMFQHMDEFTKRYGTHARAIIDTMIADE